MRKYFDFRRFPRGKKVRLALNLIVGFLTILAFGSISKTRWGESNLNSALDYFISHESSVEVGKPAPSDQICFVDIDDETYRAWGEPQLTPRDQVARIIRAAANGKARVVLLDILLEYPDLDPTRNDLLRRTVSEVASSSPLKIIFPVRIGYRGDRKKNILDDLIDANPGKFFRGVPYLSATPDDRVIRHWRLYSRYRPADASGTEILWGTPFLGAVLAGNREKLLGRLEKLVQTSTARDDAEDFSTIELSDQRRVLLSLRNTDFFLQRIRFTLIPKNVIHDRMEGNVRALKPDEIGDLIDDPTLAESFFQDRIVVVGNSSPDAGDVHSTPIGFMPGMYIMGNSVHTILNGSQPTRSTSVLDFAVELLAVVLGAFLFVHLSSFIAQMLASLVLLVIFGGFSFWYFLQHGVFFNFVFAILGMQVLAFLSDLEELILGRFLVEPVDSFRKGDLES